MKIRLTDGLNEGQLTAYNNITKWISNKNDNSMWLLEGYAGTGKTFLLSRILRHVLMGHPKWKIAITAPTNKAVRVAKRMCDIDDVRVTFQTVHRMLGLKEKITDDGRQLFERDAFNKLPDLATYHLVVIDESSMLNDELFKEIENYRGCVKILFVGDPAQIPPVGAEDSIPFDKISRMTWNINVVQLNEVMRQAAENPIIAASMEIRNNLEKGSPIKKYNTVINNNKGIVFFNMNEETERNKINPLLTKLFNCDDFRTDPDHAKVIAWRNSTVNSFNNIIRKILYGDNAAKIVVGEKLIADKPIQRKDELLFNTNDEFEVESFKIKTSIFGDTDYRCELQYYEAMVEKEEDGERIRKVIRILHESSERVFQNNAVLLKRNAIKEKKGKAWRDYYSFIREFADINYNYSLTGHKCQGSTYKNVIIVEDDIEFNRNIIERNRIRYTVYTRPSETLFVLKRN